MTQQEISLYTKAVEVCMTAHCGQTDKAGRAYYLHPMHVSVDCLEHGGSVTAGIASQLHDVVEDTEMTFEDLSKDFPQEVIETLRLLTHDKSVPYFDYVQNLKNHPDARAVKMADLRHNMQLDRLPEVTEKDLERVEKYKKAYKILEEN